MREAFEASSISKEEDTQLIILYEESGNALLSSSSQHTSHSVPLPGRSSIYNPFTYSTMHTTISLFSLLAASTIANPISATHSDLSSRDPILTSSDPFVTAC